MTTLTHPAGRAALNRVTRERYRRHCRPLPRLSLSQWAERYRVLSAEATANHGPWRNDVAPYLVEPMDCLSDRVTQETTFVAPSQSGKSEIALNAIGYFIHQEPSPIIVVQPTTETGEAFSKDRITPMLRDAPELGKLVGPARSRDSNNTIASKSYPGGQLDIVGSNAPSGLAMRPKRFVILDERDRHAVSAGKEGDVKRLVRARTRSYQSRRKIYEVSSPTDEESSLIWPSYLEGTQEVWEVPCPECGQFQTLEFERLAWDKDTDGMVRPESVRYRCAHCPHEIPAREKGALVRAGHWRATAKPKVPHKRSFWLHGLCAAFALWEEVAQEFVSADGEPDPAKRAEQLRAFFNTTLGMLYKDKRTESTKQALLDRAKRYDGGSGDDPVRFHVPREAGLLTAGFDVQDDRIEGVVRAWGAGEQSWLIERVILRGDTSQPDVWAMLDEYRQRTWLHEDGARLKIRALTVDSGDGEHTKRVYAFCAPRLHEGVYATKGHNVITAPMIPTKPTRVKPGRLYVIGVHSIMTRLYRRLGMVAPGPGYLHLNDYADEDYVTQLLSMRQVFDEKQKKRKWIGTPGVRNEVADAETYAYTALLLSPVPVASLGAEAIKVQEEGSRLAARVEAVEKAPPAPAAPKKTNTNWLPPKRGGWLR